ncbi:MAG: 16S rRNA (adenine(1518)-N(6)/adenine(1519)-N(6))-dimethyltransferase RsmA [Vicinamibacterales bacterium]
MHRARKRFGQHFLEPAWQVKVVDACRLAADDQVVEIGPGRGAITYRMAPKVARLLAFEVDRDLAGLLAARQVPGLAVHTGDVLADDVDGALEGWLDHGRPDRHFRVVGNLPYNISSPILFMLGRWWRRHPGLTDAVVMLQADVADRLLASPGTHEYGVLTILTSLSAEVTRLLDLPPGAFRPQPKVLSSLVRLRFRAPEPAVTHPDVVDRLVRTAFTQRRKTLSNGLKALAQGEGRELAAVFAAAGVDGTRRPETLHLVEFSALADAWHAAPVL